MHYGTMRETNTNIIYITISLADYGSTHCIFPSKLEFSGMSIFNGTSKFSLEVRFDFFMLGLNFCRSVKSEKKLS